MSSIIREYPLQQIVKTKTSYPVTIEEAKRHLRIDETFTLDDDYISSLIQVATKLAENYIGKDIALTDNILTVDSFSSDTLFCQEGNFLSFTSAISDTSVNYTPAKTRKYLNGFYLEFASWIDVDYLTVSFKTGFNPTSCPIELKQAILIKIGDLYDSERSSYNYTSQVNTKAFERLLDAQKILVF